MAQIKVKQIRGLQATISALSGLDNIAEFYSTSATNGDTGILITSSARETDAIQVHVNGQLLQEGFSWKKSGLIVTTDSLEAGTELVWDQTITGFSLDPTDEIKIQYETESGGSVDLGSQPASTYDDTAITGRVTNLENAPAGTSGSSGINGNDGTSGSSGINGTSGSSGTNGIDGTNGTSGSSGTSGGGGASGVISSHLIPDANEVYDIGSAAYKIRHLYLSDNSLNIGDQAVTLQDGKIHLPSLKIGDSDTGLTFTSAAEFTKDQMSRRDVRMTNLYADKISQACTPIWMQKDFGGSYYVGSGQFVSLSQDLDGNPTDLAEGYLLTCAHNLEKASGAGDHYKLYYQHAGTWRTLPEWTYVDGIADLAIIRTGRLQNAAHVLKMAPAAPVTGQKVWMCGFPGGHDTDSIVSGIIRDAHFNLNDGGQAVDSLFISSSGIGGNSGSAILDNNGDIIGIFTFAYTEHETFGGGANWNTMKSSFTRLNNGRNTAKKFVGINWARCSPFTLEDYYPATDAGGITVLEPTPLSKGCKITAIHALSPFNANFVVGDIILDATVTSGNDPGLQNWTFGFMNNQFTPGIIHYLYNTTQLSITKIGVNKIKETVLVDLMTTFADLGADKLALDTYLDGGTSVIAQANLIADGI